jgi:hypothetical protein
MNSYATGNVKSTRHDAGGLVGHQGNFGDNLIMNCYATGNVVAVGNAGGLLAHQVINSGSNMIVNSYATGNVTAETNAGGLVAQQVANNGMNFIKGGFSTGNVSAGNSAAGGIVGVQSAVVDLGMNSNVDNYRYEKVTVNGVIPTENSPTGIHGCFRTAAQLVTQSTYIDNNWVFVAAGPWVWDVQGYPKLNIGAEKFPFPSAFATAAIITSILPHSSTGI